MVDLPAGFTTRPATLNDIEAVVAVINAASQEVGHRDGIQLEEAHTYLTMPGFDIDTSTMLVLAADESIAGVEIVMNSAPYVSGDCFGAVHPSHRGKGLGSVLLRWGHQTVAANISKAPLGSRVVVQAGVESEDIAGTELMESLGMVPKRSFFDMEIDLTADLQTPQFPPGLIMRPVGEGEECALYAAIREAFEDHFGYVDRPFDEGLERFRHRMTMPGLDPKLWWVAVDGDEIAGMNLCLPSYQGDPTFAWCDNLGVRRAWRRKGLALAMLVYSFGVFAGRGHTRMGLGVDATSLTGATALYEKAGMHVSRQATMYQSVLREGESLMKETLG